MHNLNTPMTKHAYWSDIGLHIARDMEAMERSQRFEHETHPLYLSYKTQLADAREQRRACNPGGRKRLPLEWKMLAEQERQTRETPKEGEAERVVDAPECVPVAS